MKNHTPYLFIYLLYLASSCSPVVYSTVGQNVPLFRSKGEVLLNGNFCATEDITGGSGQFGIAADDHWALTTSFYYLKDYTYGWKGRSSYFELGGGQFRSLNKKQTLVAELFLGTGFGGVKNFSDDPARLNVRYIKPFIQPSIGFTESIFELAFTPRIAFVSFSDPIIRMEEPARTELELFFVANKNTWVFEPGITLRIGFRNASAQLQYNGSMFPYRNESYAETSQYFFSLGFCSIISNPFVKAVYRTK